MTAQITSYKIADLILEIYNTNASRVVNNDFPLRISIVQLQLRRLRLVSSKLLKMLTTEPFFTALLGIGLPPIFKNSWIFAHISEFGKIFNA